ncbi:hypothetical protein FO519_004328 [Halicephalobus sp. NKZ332]|nr:hypothetical protein FO519_004328 [Halicephalobus sp. NKZ332]
MDLIIVSNGVELNVSGVTEETTCLQIVYALAHATGQKGKFVLVAYLDGHEHRLSQSEKPVEIINQYRDTPVSFELRHLDQQGTALAGSPSSAASPPFFYSQLNNHNSQTGSFTALPSQPLSHSGKTFSLPPNGFSYGMQKNSRPPPPTYNEVIGQRCNSLSRDYSRVTHILPTSQSFNHIEVPGLDTEDFTRYNRQELEKIIQQQIQFIGQQKSQLLDLDVKLSNSSERELVQLKKQHNNLITVLNSLKNAHWTLRLNQEQEEGERLLRALDEMRTFVDCRKSELLNLIQLQQTLEIQLDSNFSDAETVSPQEDSAQYWSIAEYPIS